MHTLNGSYSIFKFNLFIHSFIRIQDRICPLALRLDLPKLMLIIGILRFLLEILSALVLSVSKVFFLNILDHDWGEVVWHLFHRLRSKVGILIPTAGLITVRALAFSN